LGNQVAVGLEEAAGLLVLRVQTRLVCVLVAGVAVQLLAQVALEGPVAMVALPQAAGVEAVQMRLVP